VTNKIVTPPKTKYHYLQFVGSLTIEFNGINLQIFNFTEKIVTLATTNCKCDQRNSHSTNIFPFYGRLTIQ